MRRILVFLFSVTTATLFAQTSEDFEDETLGNGPDLFTPSWSGDQSLFILVDESGDKQLRSNAGDLTSGMDYYISIPSTDISDFTWEFFIDLQFSTSGSNYVDVFLVSDDSDLSAVQNGYYVRIGDTEDWIALHKIVSGTRTGDSSPLISTATGVLSSSGSKPYKIRVTRDGSGNWELLTDSNVAGSFTSEGTVSDTDVLSSTHFGIYIEQSSAAAPADSHFFDDISITSNSTPDTDPPTIQSVSAISGTEVDVSFNEDVDETTAETAANYVLDGGVSVTGAMRDDVNNSIVHLTTSSMTNGETYTVTINNVADLSTNVIATNSQDSYQYLVFEEGIQFDVVINEFMADPNPVVGLPDAEFVELYNRSAKFLDLENWELDGQALATFQFDPDSYVIVCEDDDLALFAAFTNVLTVGTLSLNNSSADVITIVDDNMTEIHSISFEGSSGGVSFELINPNGPDYSENNFGLSTNTNGGTPEAQNSIFDATPDTTPPTITGITVVSSTELALTFDEPLEETISETLSNYTVDGGITVITAVRNASDNSMVTLTTSALVSGDTRTLIINGVEDLSGNAIAANSTIDFEYIETEIAAAGDVLVNEFYAIPSDESVIPNAEFIELLNVSDKFINLENWTFSDATGTSSAFGSHIVRPDEYLILTTVGEGASFDSYGDVLEIGSFRSLNNSGDDITITNGSATMIYSISYTTASSGITTELVNPNGPDFSENNYGLSTDSDGGTPGAQNSIFDATPDTTPPTITGIEVVSSTELTLTFDEPLEETTAETLANYAIDGGITVNAAVRNDDDNSMVTLTTSALVSGEIRTLIINGIEDLSGNAIAANSTIDFEYIETEIAEARDILVNEFYAIPSDESVIPNTEFIELLNVSDKFINLENWTFSDATGASSAFGSHILRPNEYVILTTVGEGASFDSYGDVLEVANFRSLNNSGDVITITNGSATTIYSVTYTFASSGITTELINPNGSDFSENNYGLSTNTDGGTPGAQNSIFDTTPDTTPPTITGIEVVSSTELTLTFDEPLEETTAETLANYSIDGGITVNAAVRNDDDNSIVNLTISTLTSGDTRTLIINGVEDLSGNTIAANATIDFEFIVTEIAEAGDILVNEFYAIPSDESVIPNAEFIELLNVSEKFINLENWTFSDATGTSSAFGSHIVRPDEYLILTTVGEGASFDSYGDVLEIGSFRSLNNSGDDITITNGSATMIYSISYTTASSGITTELVNPNGPDFSENNYGLSTDSDGGTPGAQNSIFDATPDTTPPTITGVEVVSSTELTLTFDEPLEETTSETLSNYTVDGGITVITAVRNAIDNSMVTLTTSALVSGEIRTLIVNGVEDLSGNAITANATIDFEYIETEIAVEGDVLVNEFYAIPSDESVIPNAEFIELLNVSDKFINLENWTFSDATGTSSACGSHVLRPNEYVILTTVGEGVSFDSYGDVLEVANFRSLNNSGDDITITNGSATMIYSISYTFASSGITTELINLNGPDFSTNNYGLSTDPDGGTPGAQNSIFDITPDTTPPTITGIETVSSTELTLIFDEPLEETTVEALANYTIDGGITVNAAVRNDDDDLIVNLTISTLTSGDTQTLTINGVEDLSGNAIAANSTIDFEYLETQPAEVGDVVVNEFYPSPSLNSGLPNAEFVELFNNSEKFIDLREWTLGDSTGLSSPFAQFVLRPDEYVILIETDNGSLFSSFGNVLEVANFPSLNNGGDAIIISNGDEQVIHQIAYSTSSSGTSTELINPDGPDFSKHNYGLSTDSDGGTPGAQNSIFDATPDTTPPTIFQILVNSGTSLELAFSEPVNQSSTETASNYSVDGEITVTSATLIEDQNVQLEVSELTSTQVRTLTVSNVSDLSGNAIAANSTFEFEFVESEKASFGDLVINEFLADPVDNNNDFVELYNRSNKIFNLGGWVLLDEASTSEEFESFVLRPDSYLIIYDKDATIDYSAFGDAISIPALTLNNTDDQIEIVDGEGDRIAFVDYTSQPGENISSELINPEDPCISSGSYSGSTNAEGSTPGSQNSVFDNSPDITAPTIVNTFFDQVLTINFSETMDLSSVLLSAFEVLNLTVEKVSADEFPVSLGVEFAESLTSGVIYEMSISGLKDCWGNEIEKTVIDFGIGRAPVFNEVIITEIQFDPDPSVGLPDIEFVEIHNATNALINIGELSFSDQTSSVPLPQATLNPGEFYLLTTQSGAAEFLTNAIGVSGFPSLSNSGEQLLLSRNGELIFSIFYNPDWHEEEKSDGGYTLEMKDISNPCSEEFNWGSSINAAGGTPSAGNSLNESIPDNFGPTVLEILAVSSDSVRITFDERIDPLSESIGTISFSPVLTIASVDFNSQYPKSLFVILSEDLVPSQEHTLSVSNVSDCNGNEVQSQALSFALPSTSESQDILLSEVLFNPKTNGVDFIELYNDSEKYLSLKNWRIGRLTEEGVSDEKEISNEELILPPGDFLVLSTNSENVLSNYPKSEMEKLFTVRSLPTFANDTGNVVLINHLGQVQESFHYEDDYHYQLLESTDGVSLERISYTAEVNDLNNWRSASSAQGFATPGYENSQTITQTAPVGKVEANPKVFVPGNSGSGRDFTTINYQFDQPGKFANITIYDQTGRLVKSVAEGALLSTSGFVRWDGTTNSGGLARLGYYVVLFEVYDSTGASETIKETIVVGRDF